MKTINNINFDTTIRVLFKIKEKKGHKTLQETYKYLSNPEIEIDNVLDVILISYNIANKDKPLSEEELQELFAENKIGFAKLSLIYKEIIEDVMFDGMTEEERKNLMTQAEGMLKK
jgi:hypothetical protein